MYYINEKSLFSSRFSNSLKLFIDPKVAAEELLECRQFWHFGDRKGV